jgi:hypothetical protein
MYRSKSLELLCRVWTLFSPQHFHMYLTYAPCPPRGALITYSCEQSYPHSSKFSLCRPIVSRFRDLAWSTSVSIFLPCCCHRPFSNPSINNSTSIMPTPAPFPRYGQSPGRALLFYLDPPHVTRRVRVNTPTRSQPVKTRTCAHGYGYCPGTGTGRVGDTPGLPVSFTSFPDFAMKGMFKNGLYVVLRSTGDPNTDNLVACNWKSGCVGTVINRHNNILHRCL